MVGKSEYPSRFQNVPQQSFLSSGFEFSLPLASEYQVPTSPDPSSKEDPRNLAAVSYAQDDDDEPIVKT